VIVGDPVPFAATATKSRACRSRPRPSGAARQRSSSAYACPRRTPSSLPGHQPSDLVAADLDAAALQLVPCLPDAPSPAQPLVERDVRGDTGSWFMDFWTNLIGGDTAASSRLISSLPLPSQWQPNSLAPVFWGYRNAPVTARNLYAPPLDPPYHANWSQEPVQIMRAVFISCGG